jgi:hypothetical protein
LPEINSGPFIASTNSNIFIKDVSNDAPVSHKSIRLLRTIWIVFLFLLSVTGLAKMLSIFNIYSDI